MRTYFFNQSPSPKRGMDVRITAYRVKRNQPHLIGCSDHQTGAWRGARHEAMQIIANLEGIPFARKRDGTIDRYELRGLIGFAGMYEDHGHPKNSVRLFELSGALQD